MYVFAHKYAHPTYAQGLVSNHVCAKKRRKWEQSIGWIVLTPQGSGPYLIPQPGVFGQYLITHMIDSLK